MYRIQFGDGTAYVGITGATVIDRLGRHLGGGGSATVREHYGAGVAYRFDVLASGLSSVQARRIELAQIARLRQPLNVTGRP